METSTKSEILWNEDIIEIIGRRLRKKFPEYKIMKGKVLKDLFLTNYPKTGFQFQFGFVDQDIVIYRDEMDITEMKKLKTLRIFKNPDAKLVIPKIICELKYDGVTSHGLITYSKYAADIKSIFPDCSYFLAVRFRKSSSDNKLFRHGKNFDRIIQFSHSSSRLPYKKGQFERELLENTSLKNSFNAFLREIESVLGGKNKYFAK